MYLGKMYLIIYRVLFLIDTRGLQCSLKFSTQAFQKVFEHLTANVSKSRDTEAKLLEIFG